MSYNQLTLSCVIIEDEAETRKSIRKALRDFNEIKLIGEADSVDSAFQLIIKEQPDMAFLDIKLIGGEAFLILDKLKKYNLRIPHIVILTSFPEFAVKAFNFRKEVVAFLEKPVLDDYYEKFRTAIDAVIAESVDIQNNISIETEQQEGTFVPIGTSIVKINFPEICWIDAREGFISFFSEEKKTTVVESMKKFLENYPNSPFVRISKNIAVNIDKITEVKINDRTACLDYKNSKKCFSIGQAFYKNFLRSLP